MRMRQRGFSRRVATHTHKIEDSSSFYFGFGRLHSSEKRFKKRRARRDATSSSPENPISNDLQQGSCPFFCTFVILGERHPNWQTGELEYCADTVPVSRQYDRTYDSTRKIKQEGSKKFRPTLLTTGTVLVRHS